MRFVHFKSIDSTNAYAKKIANPDNGACDFGPLWISADVQSGGIGRRGRQWVSETGNLFCTGLYPHKGSLASAARLSFVAALAVADTLEAYIRPDLIQIKWPNDVLVKGKKISGILLESGHHESETWVAIGIGINLVSCPKVHNYPTTHMLAHISELGPTTKHEHINAQSVLTVLAGRFSYWHDRYMSGGFEGLRKAWLARAAGIGGEVTARLSNEAIKGIALGMDANGALEIQTKSGKVMKIHAGDVFFS